MKKFQRLSVLMIAVTVGACTDAALPTEQTDNKLAAPPTAARTVNFVEGEYPTVEEYLAAGGSLESVLQATNPTGKFEGGTWVADGHLTFQYVNEADAHLNASIVDQTSGNTVNSGSDSWTYGSTIPIISPREIQLHVAISTNNRGCGITGKAQLKGRASLKLIPNPTNISLVHLLSYDQSAQDVARPSCNEHVVIIEQQTTTPPGDSNGGGWGGSGGTSTLNPSAIDAQYMCYWADHYVNEVFMYREYLYCYQL